MRNKAESQQEQATSPDSERIDFDPQDGKGALKSLGGSQSDHWNNTLAEQAVRSLALNQSSDEQTNHQVAATVAALTGIAPKDELEGMMAAQLIAAHNATMDCYRRAMHGDQRLEARRENLNQATKLSRTWTTLLDALNKHRGKGQQKVTVEHVHVHAGGQAVVGTIEHPGGGYNRKSKDQPHAKQVTHAPEPPLQSADPEREPVSVTRDAERPMPDARREVSGGAKG